ncbi:NDP-hexose 2,3-dehydratase family protein [Roseivirga misakiensis]|uniref:NDP-hexose 2,3-dehydratase n=1 Tax=Roseivirga misakiensis TaxID=1563681 RepID=A0A1E5T606_9BACT|nr:NDP-hexose 2,3-dehydratase family protein [Roseivirga misakiensis]OEK06778.1 NDP-hexose 2,3-dehydratase [Roseivirga misakiensis]
MDRTVLNTDLLLGSAITEENPFISTEETLHWLRKRNAATKVNVNKIPFREMKDWHLDEKQGALRHSSGRFFSISGINVKTNWGKVEEWEQPVIDQPEVGYLGIITKEINGILYFLLQAKIEPGNVNNVQLSPTLQATRSNYSQVHKGRKPLYLEYFQQVKRDQVILDQLQSEQGARFYKKRNRNMIIKADEDIPVEEDFIWLTLGQIKRLLCYDNVVNMDTRTVISAISFSGHLKPVSEMRVAAAGQIDYAMLESQINGDVALYKVDEIITWLTQLKCNFDLNVRPISLFDIKGWIIEEDVIRQENNLYFNVIAAQVEISNREVRSWHQPLVGPIEPGIIAFIHKRINGVSHFLVQAKLECGNFDILEMAPTVQCITGSYANSKDVPFLDYILNADSSQIRYDTLQSEEGGRFYREQNRNLIIEADDNMSEEVPDNYIWMTLHQMSIFLKFNNYLNIQARSLISTIQFLK